MHTRSDFLATGTLAMLTPALAGATSPSPSSSPSPSPKPSSEPTIPPLAFDLAGFDATLNVAAAHRHVFASTKVDGGIVLGAMRNTLNAYADVGIALHDVFPVAVLYHGASVMLAFDDAMWKEYFIPLHAKPMKNAEFAKDFDSIYDAKTHGNPCLHKKGGHEDISIESLIADAGAHFFVCNNATKGFAEFLATRFKKKSLTVYHDLAAHLVPNASLVPAGVWAVLAIQERKYTLLQTSL
ncbi:MAG: hypothetical protein WB615_14895 [Candidatus Tumulicola sp.]